MENTVESCDDNVDIPDLVSEVISMVNYIKEDKDDWQTYFGIKSKVKTFREEFDFWEDISELEDAFGSVLKTF